MFFIVVAHNDIVMMTLMVLTMMVMMIRNLHM